ncbi:MAG: YfhO family protein [Candidatus Hydrogenedentes bacterium]|nr:YfhO family protein [Candidatus Hydrogenedentota bacterium]
MSGISLDLPDVREVPGLHYPLRMRRELPLHAALLALILAAVFPTVVFQGGLISSADILFQSPPWDLHEPERFKLPQNRLAVDPVIAFRPDYLLTREAVSSGEWPLWNPLEYAGVPLLANAQSAVFNPYHLLLLWCDVDLAITLFVLIKLWLCGMTAFIAARILMLTPHAARFLSIAWMLGSYNFIWSLWPLTDVSAWLPVAVVGLELLLQGAYRRGFFALALGATLMNLAGHPETAFTMCAGAGLYFLLRLFTDRGTRGARLKRLGVAIAASLLASTVCMVQWLPLAEYIAHSYTVEDRAASYKLEFMPASGIASLWVPRIFGTLAEETFWCHSRTDTNSNILSTQYLGMAVWLGLALLFSTGVLRRGHPRRGQVACLLAASAIGLLLAYEFPALAFVHQLPLFSTLRRVYHVCFAVFALPLAATIGLQEWFSRPQRVSSLLRPALVLALIAASVIAFVLWWFGGIMNLKGMTGYVLFQVRCAVLATLCASLPLALSTRWYKPGLCWALLTLCLGLDHLFACRGLVPVMQRKYVYPETQLTQYFKEQPAPCRIGAAEGGLAGGVLTNYGVAEWLGYDGLYPARVIRFQKELGTKFWDAMEPACSLAFYLNNPKYPPVFPLEERLASGALELTDTRDGIEIYRNINVYPRAFLAGQLEVVAGPDELWKRMRDPGFVPRRVALAETPTATPVPSSHLDPPGTASIAAYTSTRVAVNVSAKESAVLVLADAFYPGWKARLNGTDVELFPVYHAFRGVIVPAGESRVEFSYEPLSFRIGLALSILALLGSAAACFIILHRARLSAQQPADP